MAIEFDIKGTLGEMLGVMKQTAADSWGEVKGVAEQFAKNSAERLKMLAEMKLHKEIDEDEFKSKLDDEKLMLEAEFNAMSVLTKAIAQRAINAAIDVFTGAVEKAAKTIL